ncbi:hypothetical protein AAMO2058_000772900 [Amorphochlora amoebiformis]
MHRYKIPTDMIHSVGRCWDKPREEIRIQQHKLDTVHTHSQIKLLRLILVLLLLSQTRVFSH